MYRIVAVLLAVPAVLGSPLSTHYGPTNRQQSSFTLAPFITAAASPINNSYIVVLKDDVDPSQILAHHDFLREAHDADPLVGVESNGLRHVYDHNIKGYAGRFSEPTVDKIRSQPEVDFVEQDQTVWASKYETEKGAPWGLARLSHRDRLTIGTFRTYNYDSAGGDGVDVYVIDTGINVDHVEFQGRAVWGKTIPENDFDVDGNGHGTHCAGTIASRKYGVAKGATVIAVKVLGSNGSGSMSDVVAGVEWASTTAVKKAVQARADPRTKHKGSVANMSLGGGKSTALDRAVNGAVDKGLNFAVAAGNDNKDACDYSPAAAENAVTVGATTLEDTRAFFSNYGPCVDVFAPGYQILSTWTGSNTSTNTISGTSMASPHVAGLLAYLLSIYPSVSFDPTTSSTDSSPSTSSWTTTLLRYAHTYFPIQLTSYLPSLPLAPIPPTIPALTPKQLKTALLALASEDKLRGIPEKTVNLLAYNNVSALLSESDWVLV